MGRSLAAVVAISGLVAFVTGCTALAVVGDGAGGTGVTTTTGAGDGVTTTTTDAGTTPAATSASTGCAPACADRRCGDDRCGGLCGGREEQATWRVDFDGGGAKILLDWQDTQSVFVGMENNRVLRLDTCDGSVLAELDLTQASTGDHEILGLARVDDDLYVASRAGNAQQLQRYGARDLAQPDPALEITNPQIGPGAGVQGADALFFGTAGGSLARVGYDGSKCLVDSQLNGSGRAIRVDGEQVFLAVTYWNEYDAHTRIVDFGVVGDDCSATRDAAPQEVAENFEALALLSDATTLYAVGSLMRYSNRTLSIGAGIRKLSRADLSNEAYWARSGGGFTNFPAFYDAAFLGNDIVAVGEDEATPNGQNTKGWIVRLPTSFDPDTEPTVELVLPSTRRVTTIRPVGTAIYLAGRADILNAEGAFVAKCDDTFACLGAAQ